MSRSQDRRRRVQGRSVDPVLLLAVVIPLLTVGVLATVHPAPTEEGARGPSAAPLTRTVVACPPAVAGAVEVAATLADPAAAGALTVGGGDDLPVPAGEVASRGTRGSVLLRGTDSMASGLVVSRGGAGAGTDCRGPESDVWFAGVGAGPEHASVLTLTNPDGGPAVADVTVHAADGLREVDRLRGVAVEPRSEVALDLAALMPEREDATIRLTVTRGRLASSIADSVDPVGGGPTARAWLPPVAAPATEMVLPGVGRGAGERHLVLTNPGEDQARVEVRALTADSEFSPTDLEPVQVAPGATTTVNLSGFLRSGAASDVLGLRLVASEPVTGLLRSRQGNRLVHATASTPLRSHGALLVDTGPKRLVLAGATEPSDVRVLQRTGAGRVLDEQAVTVRPGRGLRLDLAPGARLVQVVVEDAPVSATVELGGGGVPFVRPVGELVTQTWVPHVGPALY